MSRGTSILLSFVAGVGVGFYSAMRFLQDKYEKQTREEIDAVKQELRSRNTDEKLSQEKTYTPTNQEKTRYADILRSNGYRTEERREPDFPAPYTISPDCFGEEDTFEQITLVYYTDDVLTDDTERPMPEDMIEEIVGRANLSRFGEYEPDIVLVRNERLKVDYEILRDPGSYADMLKDKPWLAR